MNLWKAIKYWESEKMLQVWTNIVWKCHQFSFCRTFVDNFCFWDAQYTATPPTNITIPMWDFPSLCIAKLASMYATTLKLWEGFITNNLFFVLDRYPNKHLNFTWSSLVRACTLVHKKPTAVIISGLALYDKHNNFATTVWRKRNSDSPNIGDPK